MNKTIFNKSLLIGALSIAAVLFGCNPEIPNNNGGTKIQDGDTCLLSSYVIANKQQIIYVYDESCRMTQLVSYIWDNGWIEYNRCEYLYDNNDNRISETNYRWENNSWVESGKYTGTYDANGNITVEISYSWNNDINTWVESLKFECNYDSNDNITFMLWFQYGNIEQIWNLAGKLEIIYSADIRTDIEYGWSNTTNLWFPLRKNEYAYNTAGKTVTSEHYSWNSDTNDWKKENRYEYEYNENGNITSEVFFMLSNSFYNRKYEYAYDTDGKVTTRTEYNYISGVWEQIYVAHYNYNCGFTRPSAPSRIKHHIELEETINRLPNTDIHNDIRNIPAHFDNLRGITY
jgi:hypothetical protein